MAEKKRLDTTVFERGLAQSREKAQVAIKAGQVLINGKEIKKPSEKVDENDKIEVVKKEISFVSRGGLKLQKAINVFSLDLNEYVCIDIGASTGGFTDCMLQCGAKKVYAVDVGFDQLAEKLRKDKRVVNIEKTNFRELTNSSIPEPVDFACADISFISLRYLFPVLKEFLKIGANAVCLIKPQFEAGKEKVGKNGIVKDKRIHAEVIKSVCESAAENGFSTLDIDYSPIKGQKGNIEYLLLIERTEKADIMIKKPIEDIVIDSHNQLSGC